MQPGVRTVLERTRRQPVLALRSDERGATAVEYGLIAALIVVAVLSALKGLGMDIAALPMQSLIDALQSVL